MQKIVFLSLTGIKDSPENPKFLNPFLASLKKNVKPFFDMKVILLDTSFYSGSIRESDTYKKIVDYGLEEDIELQTIHTLGFPEKSINFLMENHWFPNIGHNMNGLFEYAKQFDFWGADWVFHTDTDIYVNTRFENMISSLSSLVSFNDNVVVSVAGDAYPAYIETSDSKILLESPDRISLFDETITSSDFYGSFIGKNEYTDRKNASETIYVTQAQYKIRNDFFGFSRGASLSITPNWVSYNSPQLKEFNDFKINVFTSHDKGSSLFYSIKEGFKNGYNNLIHVQLPLDCVHHHYSSGFSYTDNFSPSKEHLLRFHKDIQHLWEMDYS